MAQKRPQKTSQHIEVAGMPVELVRGRVRNINLRVRPDSSVRVSAPRSVSLAQVEAFVASRATWIRRAQHRVAAAHEGHDATCRQGQTILLWGEPLTCHITSGEPMGRSRVARISHGASELIVTVSDEVARDLASHTDALQRALDTYLRTQLREAAEALLPSLEATVGVKASGLRFRRMSSRWGSCNVRSGMITLNTQLVHHDPECLAYVLTHELCHLHEPSHNARFHALMDRFYPTWRTVRARLNGKDA